MASTYSVHCVEIVVAAVAWDHPDSVRLRGQQRAELDERYGTPDSEPGPAPTAADIELFLVACVSTAAGPQAVGCGGLRRLDASSAEVKRMYVEPAHRGTGVATAVLHALEQEATALGLTVLRLETGDQQPDAMRFYEREGYRAIPCFGHYAGSALSRCYEFLLPRR